jgi:hypothetical protein
MPPTTQRVRVLVGKDSASGSLVPIKPRITAHAECVAWIDDSNELRREPLTVEISVLREQYGKVCGMLAFFHAAEVTGRLTRRGGKHVFKATDVKPRSLNAAFKRVLEEIRPLPVIEDESLGKLKFNSLRNLYTKRVRFGGEPITLEIDAYSRDEAAGNLATAKVILKDSAKWAAWVKQFIATTLLKETNAMWREDMKPLTAAQLAKQVALRSITVCEKHIELYLAAKGELYGGHWVQLFVSDRMKLLRRDFIG